MTRSGRNPGPAQAQPHQGIGEVPGFGRQATLLIRRNGPAIHPERPLQVHRGAGMLQKVPDPVARHCRQIPLPRRLGNFGGLEVLGDGQGFVALRRGGHGALEGRLRMQRVRLIGIDFGQVGALRGTELLQGGKIGLGRQRVVGHDLVEGFWHRERGRGAGRQPGTWVVWALPRPLGGMLHAEFLVVFAAWFLLALDFTG
jgi:hypothetical protein